MSRYGSTTAPARNASFGVNADGTVFTTAPILNLRYPDGEPYITFEGRVGYPLGNTLPLQTPIERYTGFFRGSYDVTENVEAYLQFNYMTYDSATAVQAGRRVRPRRWRSSRSPTLSSPPTCARCWPHARTRTRR
ncbi:hypothetical protein LRS10_21455 [Phenylobacterium sp. J426]|uniref:hypothetical protein n=1 Tax=Phenylobacterium sp. J426 TaxID=2898439 RepID=UPI0021516F93|nr:hypothetical protein [Phenylobacterium sp. J426]MCR5876484.1 hypothetical protein [Phenylobacterium sp. J426]